MKVKITKCSNDSWWYSYYVGEIFEVDEQIIIDENDKSKNYRVKDPKSNCNDFLILIEDVEIINEISLENLFLKIEQLEQQVKELQNRQPQYIYYPIYPSSENTSDSPYLPTITALYGCPPTMWSKNKEDKQ
jgi:hypothetical protein